MPYCLIVLKVTFLSCLSVGRCSVFPDINVVTFDGNNVALYKAAAYVVTQLMNETITIFVQECNSSDSTVRCISYLKWLFLSFHFFYIFLMFQIEITHNKNKNTFCCCTFLDTLDSFFKDKVFNVKNCTQYCIATGSNSMWMTLLYAH